MKDIVLNLQQAVPPFLKISAASYARHSHHSVCTEYITTPQFETTFNFAIIAIQVITPLQVLKINNI